MPSPVPPDPRTSEAACATPSLRVAVLKGGPSSEREISLRSGEAVAAALRQAGHCVFEIDVTEWALPQLPEVDVVFPALHGPFGEDGGVQRLLEERGIPYVGSGVEASELMMDKLRSKEVVRGHGVPTPNSVRIDAPDAPSDHGLRYPLIVKPNGQGSSLGMTKLTRPSGWWRRALSRAFALDSCVLAEEFVSGVEVTAGIILGEALPVIEIVPPKGHMFDYDAKYEYRNGHTRYHCPPETVSEAIQAAVQRLALTAYDVLGARDLLRVDFIVDEGGTPWFLEANSIPGFTGTSLVPKAAKALGIDFPELCSRLVRASASNG